MKIFKKILCYYFVGVLFSASIIGLIILFDYYINGYIQYPELSNLIMVCLISGLGFGVTYFAFNKIRELNNTKNN
jgi:hypothetical protein